MTEAWVCLDCYWMHHYGRSASDDPAYVPDRRPLSLITSEAWDFTDSETGDGIADFSWSPCEGCGSNLGGARYRLAVNTAAATV